MDKFDKDGFGVRPWRDGLDDEIEAEQEYASHPPEDVRPDCGCPLCALVRRTLGTFA